jgi:Escherichia/Staphylococcus phage prohead protease
MTNPDFAVELRKDGTAAQIGGLASIFSRTYKVGNFVEDVAPGSFERTLSESPDVLFTSEHDRGKAVARTSAGTLKLWTDDYGLRYQATVDVANDLDARTLVSKIENRTFPQSSFAFRVPNGGDSWNQDFTRRTITRVDLHHGDVSVVAFGASPTTTASVTRARGTLSERRELAERISATGWCGPVLLNRQDLQGSVSGNGNGNGDDDAAYDPDTDTVRCPGCAGRGYLGDGRQTPCPTCGGSGRISASPTDPVASDANVPDYSGNSGRAANAAGSDPDMSPSHNVDSIQHHLAHAARHNSRLPESNDAQHVARHLEKAQGHVGKLVGVLSQHPSDPARFTSEMAALKAMERSEARRDRTDAEVQALGKRGWPSRCHRASTAGRSLTAST